jgi:hypothetical protein
MAVCRRCYFKDSVVAASPREPLKHQSNHVLESEANPKKKAMRFEDKDAKENVHVV